MPEPEYPALVLARELVPLVRQLGTFKGACEALGIPSTRAAYTLMRAELYNTVLAAKYMEVDL